ncbi:hypothetical protein C5167_026201 [Papaver somniferum]|uniref:uncharacterized protein LOC113346514 n=1 Tax=Papaver somniferum TaxID=3469 RepID=UPI000E705B1E|nr:uncharacterized protein LOC113346514 [Papaver somniferum]RZC94470.1 hypothetical protein C5167_026201 [Papaver somniferum]
MKGFSGQKHFVKKTGRKRREVHVLEVGDFEADPDYVMYLKTLNRYNEEGDDDADDNEDCIEEEEDRNEGIHVDIDREMEMDGNGIDVVDDLDPEYKMFLVNLREDGNSYVLEMTSEKGKSVYVNYEEPLSVQSEKNVQSDDLGGNISHEGKRGFATKKIRKEGPSNDGLKEMPSMSLPPRPSKGKSTPINDSRRVPLPPKCIKRNSSAINDSCPTPVHPEGIKRNSTPTNDCHLVKEYSKRKSTLINDSHPFLDEFKLEKTSTVDESYYMFLKSVRVRGKAMYLMTDEMILEYGEENMVTLSVPEKSPKYGVLYSKELEFGLRKPQKCHELLARVMMDEDDQEEYANKLLKIINMPYDVKEYRDKYDLASERQPVKRCRDTRRRSVKYETDEMGRSYFDHYSDLKEMVDRAREQGNARRALLLLRWLFFYNETVAQEGSFVPWRKPSFMRQILGPA